LFCGINLNFFELTETRLSKKELLAVYGIRKKDEPVKEAIIREVKHDVTAKIASDFVFFSSDP